MGHPPMEAGIADRVWGIEEIVSLVGKKENLAA
jgi:hypothetical protein